MGIIRDVHPVKLVTGFIFKEESVLAKAESALKRAFGDTDYQSPHLAFDLTDYYAAEFGTGLKRKFISFRKLIPAGKLADIKALSNRIEKRLSPEKRRLINIDPGYLDMAKLVLASTKDYRHRIYLEKGIFAEITLSYRKKSFAPWEWTYPDYASAAYIKVFNQIRELYASQIQKD